MRYMSCLRKLHERTSIWMSLILKLRVCDIIFGEPQGQSKFSVGTVLRSTANFGWGRAVQQGTSKGERKKDDQAV